MRHEIPTNRRYKKGNVFQGPDQTIYTKNALLEGLSLADIYLAVHDAKITPGFKEARNIFASQNSRQVLFSETLLPVVDYFVALYGLDHGEATQPVISLDGKEIVYRAEGSQLRAALTGKTEKFDKETAFFKYLEREKIPLDSVAAIGDSTTDIPIIKKIRANGGIGFGFNTGKYVEDYRSAGIPIIKGLDLRVFAEVVLNPSSIRQLCEFDFGI